MKKTVQRLSCARVDSDKPLKFEYDGQTYQGFEGDSLASALLANGVDIVGRSFKLHRPRGVFAAGKEEVNAFVQLEEGAFTEPNARATIVRLYDGLTARSQNAWPSVRFDLWGLVGLFKRVLPAGFYYKTFMWPRWSYWDKIIRHSAGLGKAPAESDGGTYQRQSLHADLLIIGAGRSGLKAALEAARDDARRIVLIDEQEYSGGGLLSSIDEGDRNWLSMALDDLAARDNVTLMQRTTAIAYYDHNILAAVERVAEHQRPVKGDAPRERLWTIQAGEVVLATGAHERPMVFPNNDRPGIMLASAVREYALRYGLTLSDNIVFYANNDSAWRTALDLKARGLAVNAIIDVRPRVEDALASSARNAGISLHQGYVVTNTRGRKGVKSLTLQRLSADGSGLEGASITLACELVAMSGGWSPVVHLFSQSGGNLAYREEDACFVPDSAHQSVTSVGRANGDFSRPLNIRPFWSTPGVSPQYQWVDFQYDVTASDIALAARENYVSVEHFKRYTTNGMSIDQGKTSNVNGLAILANEIGKPIPQVGTTRFRPPYHPTSLGAYAGACLGQLYYPYQHLPAHRCHRELNPVIADMGDWQRPECYPREGENAEQAIHREVIAVRNGVGLLDYSPLGKIEVHGPDAREFLNRIYINNIYTLKVGQARYGLMLNERGIVVDDGVMVCLAEDHFLLHTTSGGAGTSFLAMEEWLQCEWLDLKVVVTNNTTQWATLMLSGPQSRDVMRKLNSDIDFSKSAFAHMQYREGTLGGVPARVLRASFTGEVSYEVSVPARYAESLWQSLMEAGAAFDITPFGIESLMVLRTEKGYLHVGGDTDGNTMPQDLGWGRAIEKQEADFVGKRSLSIPVGIEPGRLQFTGIELVDSGGTLIDGAHVLTEDGNNTAGYVTSSHFSPTLNRTVALGIVADAHSREGDTVKVYFDGSTQLAKLVKPGAYDPTGERLNG